MQRHRVVVGMTVYDRSGRSGVVEEKVATCRLRGWYKFRVRWKCGEVSVVASPVLSANPPANPTKRRCREPGCNGLVRTRDLCESHYAKAYRLGKLR